MVCVLCTYLGSLAYLHDDNSFLLPSSPKSGYLYMQIQCFNFFPSFLVNGEFLFTINVSALNLVCEFVCCMCTYANETY